MTGQQRSGHQLTLDLPLAAAQTRSDFFVSANNATALATLDDWQQGWPQARMLLIGPAGAGKTHLAQIWAQAAGAEIRQAATLAEGDVPDLATCKALVVEDAETLPQHAQAALFHLHNLLQGRGHLLITASRPPRDWGMTLPDLASRMQAMANVRLDAPDEGLLAAVLVKLFADRQIIVPPNLISYLTLRMDRSLHAAAAIVARLDAAALARQRPITRAFAAEVLDLDAGT
ncbi:MAG: DnaA/Hda family protein [Rhodobacteraceae bacterium]|jgi:chromosomal replication initiation ATPase DnaA|nr:DnaA/Hda family protein [Paracoccaceae bacterium]